jgi:hypothetical protein
VFDYVIGRDPSSLTPAARAAYEEATSVAPPDWGDHQMEMLPRRRHRGWCRLCGETATMTKEHVPPRSVGNKGNLTRFTFRDWLDRAEGTLGLGSGIKGGGGMGGFTLCKPCNSFTGGEYGGAFRDWYATFAHLMSQLPTPTERDAWPYTPSIPLTLRTDPGAVIRQALSSFTTLAGTWRLTERHPEIRELVRHKVTCLLPAGMRVFVGMATGPRARLAGPMLVVEASGHWMWVMELAHPPVVFTMVLASNHRNHPFGAEVSSFTLAHPGQVMDVDLTVPVGFTWSPYLGDLRSSAQMRADRDPLIRHSA